MSEVEMEDNFFGFDTEIQPSFGVGKHAEDGLMPAAQEYDAYNDETFGALEGGWETTHEALEESYRQDKQTTTRLVPTSKPQDFESSLSQLVEDYDEAALDNGHVRSKFDDPAIMNVPEGRPIPGRRQQNLDELFGPSSPPAFLGTEQLVSPGKQNIWGSPMKESPVREPTDNGLKALLHQLQGKAQPSTPFQDPSIVTLGKSLPNVKTLEELEQELVGQRPSSMTLDQLEGELRGHGGQSLPTALQTPRRGSSPSVQSPMSLPIGTPPTVSHMQRGQQMQMANRAVQQAMGGGRTSPQVVPQAGRMSPMQQMGMSPPVHPMGMTPPGPDSRRPHPQFMTPRVMSPYRNINPRMLAQMSPQQLHMYAQMATQQHHTPGPANRSSSLTPSPGHPRMQMPYSDHGRGRRSSGPQQRSHTVLNSHTHTPSAPARRPHPQQMQQQYQQQQQQYHNRRTGYQQRNYSYNGGGDNGFGDRMHHGDYRDYDEDAGLMTKKEKDWVIKIQLMQLQTENPYLDDYYYSTLMMRKKMEEVRRLEQERGGAGDGQEPKLVLPQFSKVESRTYRPAQFEGSLGKLTAASVHNPRQIIDKINRGNSSDSEDQKAKNIRKFKELLLDIEKLYDLLLTIDDLEKRVLALPEDGRPPLLEERRQKMCAIHGDLVREEGSFMARCLGVRKGRSLINRVMPLLSTIELSAMTVSVLQAVCSLSKKDQQDQTWTDLYGVISGIVQRADLEMLVLYAEGVLSANTPIQPNATANLIQHKFGWSLVCCMLHRGEAVYSQQSIVIEPDKLKTWNEFVSHVADVISSLQDSSTLQTPLTQYKDKNITRHLERLADHKTIAHIESKLQTLLVS